MTTDLKKDIELNDLRQIESFSFLELDALHDNYFGKYKRVKNVYAGVGVGWWEPLKALFDSFELLCTEHNTLITIKQIKEKFASLRVYYQIDTTDEAVKQAAHDLYAKAETACAARCEICGDVGEKRAFRWAKTLCDRHTNAQKAMHSS